MTDFVRALRRALAVLVMLALPALSVRAAGDGTLLDTYLKDLSTWSADFTQVTEDERGARVGTGAGRLVIVRPGRFRWESSVRRGEPPVQLMAADGKNLWSLDYDLEQATVKPQEEVLPQSPAMLLAGGSDLRSGFTVEAGGRRDGHDWVVVRPKQAESDFREARFGFRSGVLALLVVVDKLGQRSTLTFSNVRRNPAVDPALVSFTLPQGVDLIGTPVPP